jgi:hypothetical protein
VSWMGPLARCGTKPDGTLNLIPETGVDTEQARISSREAGLQCRLKGTALVGDNQEAEPEHHPEVRPQT